MKKLIKIESEIKQELKLAFKETKKDLDPLSLEIFRYNNYVVD